MPPAKIESRVRESVADRGFLLELSLTYSTTVECTFAPSSSSRTSMSILSLTMKRQAMPSAHSALWVA